MSGRVVRIAVGLVFWLALAVFAAWRLDRLGRDSPAGLPRLARQICSYFAGRTRRLTLTCPDQVDLAVCDPVFVEQGDGELRLVGLVRRLGRDGQWLGERRAYADRVEVVLLPCAAQFGPIAQALYFNRQTSLLWVARTLLTPQRRAEIAAELQRVLDRHGDELLKAIRPLVVRTLFAAAAVAEADLPAAIERRRDRWAALGQRYEREIVEREVVPLVRKEVWPIVVKQAEPLANEIGEELWQRVSLWRFAWRMAYDRLPLPELDLTQREWQRFVEQEVVPTIEEHMDQIVAVLEDILKEVSRNEAVKEAVRRNLTKVASDPEFQTLMDETLREVVVENERMRQAVQQVWSSPEAIHALQLGASRFEPAVRRIATRMLGSLEEGITPEFARVLRSHLLDKDRRWVLLQPGPAAANQPATVTLVKANPDTWPAPPLPAIKQQ